MAATIVINDSVNPPAAGSKDLDVSFLTKTFTLSNQNNTGVLAWRWTLVDRPIGSAAALSASTTATTTFVPDVAGSYLLRLQTYTDAGATVLDDADEQVVGVRFAAPYNWLIPAAGETSQQNASRGWAQSREQAIRAVHAFMATPATVPVLTGNVAWVDKVNGNDGTAVLGRLDKPYLTIQAAITASSAGDTVVILPGTYNEVLACKAGVSVIGTDERQCIVSRAHNLSEIVVTMADNMVFENIRLDLAPTGGTTSAFDFPGTTCATSSVKRCVVNGTAGTVAGVIVSGTGVAGVAHLTVDSLYVLGSGAALGYSQSGAGVSRVRDMHASASTAGLSITTGQVHSYGCYWAGGGVVVGVGTSLFADAATCFTALASSGSVNPIDNSAPLSVQGNAKVIGQVYTPIVTIANPAGTINTDCDLSNVFKTTLNNGANALADPTNIQDGASYAWHIINVAGATLSYGAKFKWAGGTALTVSGGTAIDYITAIAEGGNLYATWNKAFA